MKARLGGLDALRGLAALCVLGYHLHTVYGGFNLFMRSYLAVDFFFMLSGFVMARSYEDRLAEGLEAKAFFSARYRRLFPPMCIGAILGYLLLPAEISGSEISFLATLLFIPTLGPEPFPANRPTWSIFFELFANALHALCLWRFDRKRLLLIASISAIGVTYLGLPSNSIALGNKADDFVGGIPRVLLAYTVGMVIFRSLKPFSLPLWPSYLLLISALLLIPHGLLMDLLFVVAISPILIVLGAQRGERVGAIWLGRLSFPLYAVHYPILQFGERASLSPYMSALIAILFASAIATIFDTWLPKISARRTKK